MDKLETTVNIIGKRRLINTICFGSSSIKVTIPGIDIKSTKHNHTRNSTYYRAKVAPYDCGTVEEFVSFVHASLHASSISVVYIATNEKNSTALDIIQYTVLGT